MEMFRRPGGDVIRHGQPGRRCSRRRDFLDPVASPGHALQYGALLEEEADGMDRHRITAAGVSAEVSAKGAELISLCDAAGSEMLWQAGTEWPRHFQSFQALHGLTQAST